MGDEIVAGAVFDRIRGLYGLASDAAMARHLGIYPQDIPRQRKSGNPPFEAILKACPPKDWPYIFLGLEAAPEGVEAALRTLAAAGYRVTLEPIPAPQAPPGAERKGSHP